MDSLQTLLTYTLAIGNYLNGQSNNGGAFGFKLDIMSQLDDVKTTDNQSNLLIYILLKIEKETSKSILPNPEIDLDFLTKNAISQLDADLNELKNMEAKVDKAKKSQSDDKRDEAELK